MIIISSNNSIDSWDPEELWIDWLTGYQCRKALFLKDSTSYVNFISSSNVSLPIFLIPNTISPKNLVKNLSGFVESSSFETFLSLRTRSDLAEILARGFPKIEMKDLKQLSLFTPEITDQSFV